MCVCSVTIIPVGKGTSLLDPLSHALDALEKFPDVKHQVTPMSTDLEGPVDRVFEAIKAMHKAAFETGVQRVCTTITLDERRDKEEKLEDRVMELENA